jgi:hypothetical protein
MSTEKTHFLIAVQAAFTIENRYFFPEKSGRKKLPKGLQVDEVVNMAQHVTHMSVVRKDLR